MKSVFALIAFALMATIARAQAPCYTHEHYLNQIAKDAQFLANQQILEQVSLANDAQPPKKERLLVTIPVVVHVLHQGEPIGQGYNISQSQIESQIDALNEDFRHKNADSLPATHPFKPFAADVDIEFCLAKRSPNNVASTGVIRYKLNVPSLSIDDMETYVKPKTIWDRNRYLNLWVTNLVEPSIGGTLLGYAQFPGGADSTDGVAMLTTAFGYTGNVMPPSDYGRTCVHEVGHWLNLRHIWGDSYCGNDGVSDTPPAEDKHSGCVSFPHNAFNACGAGQYGEMYMNYMDYSTDKCLVMFTKGQKTRMHTAINMARSGLKNSLGCVPSTISNIDEIEPNESLIQIYPNPVTTDFVQIRLMKNIQSYTLSLLDINGRVLQKIPQPYIMNDYMQLDLSGEAAGIYYVQLESEGYKTTKKVVKL